MGKFTEGDLVKIPFPDGRVALVKVLYISKLFKNVIGVGVCQWVKQNTLLRNLEVDPIKGNPLYTNVLAAKDYQWSIIGNRGLTEQEEARAIHVVGNTVYLKDTSLRNASDNDLIEIPEMLVTGMPNIYKWIERILDKGMMGPKIVANPEQIPM